MNDLRAEVAKIRWFHCIDFGNGIVTPGANRQSAELARRVLPNSFAGKTVLDVGAWDGFFSFEAERRGAARVLATDHFCWSGPGWGSKAGFDLARRVFGSKVEDKDIDVMSISPEAVGMFDVVMFFGVLYHLKDPLGGLERVASVTRETLYLETHIMNRGGNRPLLEFYPGSELQSDPTNWFGPNKAAVEGMLRACGFRTFNSHVWRRSRPYRFARALRNRVRDGTPFRTAYDQARLIVEARR